MDELVVLADALTDAEGLGARFQDLLVGTVMSLMVVLSVITTWRQTKSILAALGAFLGGAALWYAVMNAVVFRDSILPAALCGRASGNKGLHIDVDDDLCPQPASLVPSTKTNADVWSTLVPLSNGTYSSHAFHDRAINWLGGAVRIPYVPSSPCCCAVYARIPTLRFGCRSAICVDSLTYAEPSALMARSLSARTPAGRYSHRSTTTCSPHSLSCKLLLQYYYVKHPITDPARPGGPPATQRSSSQKSTPTASCTSGKARTAL